MFKHLGGLAIQIINWARALGAYIVECLLSGWEARHDWDGRIPIEVLVANATRGAGSNIFLLILVMGISAFFSGSGLRVSPSVTYIEVPILLAVTALVILLFQRHALHRAAGTGLLALYCGYIAYVVARGG